MDAHRIDEAYDQAERLRSEGKCASAHTLYSAVIAAWPEFAPAYAGLAWCKIRLGDFAGAVESLAKAQRLDPGNHEYRRALARAKALLDPPRHGTTEDEEERP